MILLSVVVLALAIACNLNSPLQFDRNGRTVGSNPDEYAHLLNVQRVSQGHLPVFVQGDGDYEAHQPPLYYAVTAPFALLTRSMDNEHSAQIVRIPSIVFGIALLWVVFALVQLVLPTRPWIAFGAAAFVGLLPMNVTLVASITNDVLTNLIMAIALWKMAKVVESADAGKPESVFRRSRVLGIILGVGIWTKTSTLLLFPVAVVLYFVLMRRNALTAQQAARSCGIAVLIGLAIGAPWLIRNTLLYGDPVAQHIFVTAFQNTALAKDMMNGHTTGYPLTLAEYAQWVVMWTFQSFWFRRGTVPDAVFNGPLVIAVLAVIGAVAYYVKERKAWSAGQTAMVASFVTLFVLTMLAFVRFNMTFFQAQGRYLYTALAPLAFFTVAGLSSLVPAKSEKLLVAVLTGVMIVYSGTSLSHIISSRPY
jgi:hypothetical protein